MYKLKDICHINIALKILAVAGIFVLRHVNDCSMAQKSDILSHLQTVVD